MKARKLFLSVVTTGLIFAGLTTMIMHTDLLASSEVLEQVAIIEIFLSTFNIIILSALAVNYTLMYREMSTSIARSMMLFSSALLMYAISSSPLIRILLGFNMITIGPLTYIPDLFVAAASLTLLYESFR
ncbi:MAG: hypothetical protein ABEJ99_04830 [Candidatus Nanohaloarchaea archaeon]